MNSLNPKFRISLLFLCLFFCLSPFIADAYVFRVLGVSGKVFVRKGAQEATLKAGTKLEEGQSLIVESGYCGLVHASGKIIELKTAGTYAVADLSKRFSGSGKTKVSEKYFDYVMGQLSQKEADDIDKNIRGHMDVPGSVDRSARTVSASGESIASARVFAFKSNEVRPDLYILEWEPAEGIKSYTVSLKNRFEEVAFSREVSENKIDLDFGKIPSQVPDSYTLQVTYKGNKALKDFVYLFKVGNPEDLGLQKEDNSPATLMLNGIICEENHLYLDALKYYKDAHNLEPGVGTYAEAYEKLRAKMDQH